VIPAEAWPLIVGLAVFDALFVGTLIKNLLTRD
jgi:hypothetical protein